jgi:aryl-alcohol dehydrogenase-like predicted oxidoreductase
LASIKADCETSLRRLRVEVIDLLQIHWPEAADGTPIEESWAAMRRLVDEGKIRAAGVCNFDRDLLERCERVGHVDSLQLPFSMIARESAAGLIQWCAANRTAVLAYSPMQIGLLTDSFSPGTLDAMHKDDWRRRHPEFQGQRLERNLELRDRLRALASKHGTTVSAIAVAWVLAWSEVTGAIVGASRATQVDDWLAAGTIKLSATDLSSIASSIRQSGAGSGPLRPGQLRTTST